MALSEVLDRAPKDDPIGLGLSARVVADAGRGLHAAHELRSAEGRDLGVVHRDVCPQNIAVLFEGAVKVVDFGVARAEGRLEVTEDGHVRGHASYAAPEQILGGEVDRRSDLWSLGVVLWEATLGDRLFPTGSAGSTMMSVLNAPIRRPAA